MSCTLPTASKLVRDFESRGWLKELTGYGRNRLWRYQPYGDLFHREALDAMVGAPRAAAAQVTGNMPGTAT